MAELRNLLILGALASAIENQQNEEAYEKFEKESLHWTVICPSPCNTQLSRRKGYDCYNASPNSTIQCNKCRGGVSAKQIIFHCPKEHNLFHLQGFDYCLECANKQCVEMLETPNNNNDDDISALKEEIADYRRTIDAQKNEIDQLKHDKLGIQTECRSLKHKLDDKLDIIAQYKDDMKTLKHKFETRRDTVDETKEISPILKAVLSQRFLNDDATKHMPKEKFIMALHNEILGLTFASHQTLCWMQKNCRKAANDEVFSFNNYQYGYNMNDESKNRNDIMDLNEFDSSTVQKLQKMLKMLQSKYDECSKATAAWNAIVKEVLNPKSKSAKKENSDWRSWNSQQVLTWILSLDNGRFIKYANVLQNANLNVYRLKSMENYDLFEIGVHITADQRILLKNRDALINGNNGKESNDIHQQPGFEPEGITTKQPDQDYI